jgi:hypothetical protein
MHVECYSQIISSDRRSLEVENLPWSTHTEHTVSDEEEICTKHTSRVIILNIQSSAKGARRRRCWTVWLALILDILASTQLLCCI